MERPRKFSIASDSNRNQYVSILDLHSEPPTRLARSSKIFQFTYERYDVVGFVEV